MFANRRCARGRAGLGFWQRGDPQDRGVFFGHRHQIVAHGRVAIGAVATLERNGFAEFGEQRHNPCQHEQKLLAVVPCPAAEILRGMGADPGAAGQHLFAGQRAGGQFMLIGGGRLCHPLACSGHRHAAIGLRAGSGGEKLRHRYCQTGRNLFQRRTGWRHRAVLDPGKVERANPACSVACSSLQPCALRRSRTRWPRSSGGGASPSRAMRRGRNRSLPVMGRHEVCALLA